MRVVMMKEIGNLCDSWEKHQAGDDDRLSTLLTCFMMVAQCVPNLGACYKLTPFCVSFSIRTCVRCINYSFLS